MRWSEVDSKVSTRCIISFNDDSPIFQYTSLHDISTIVIIQKINGFSTLTFLIKKPKTIDNNTRFFLKKFNAEDRGDFWYIKTPMGSSEGFKAIEELSNTPSVIMGFTYLNHGRLTVDFRLHPSKVDEVSDILMEHISKDDKIILESLTSNSGEISFLTELNTVAPLSFIKFSIPATGNDPIEKYLSCGDYIAEIEKKAGQNYHALIYTNSPLEKIDGLTVISDKEYIYEAQGGNPILQEIRRIANENVIFRASHFLRIKNNELIVSVFVPSYQVQKFLQIFSNKRRVGELFPVTIHDTRPFNLTLFENI